MVVECALCQIFNVSDTDNLVEVFTDDRNARITAAKCQRERLAKSLIAFDPDHICAVNHEFAYQGIAEFKYRVDHLVLI